MIHREIDYKHIQCRKCKEIFGADDSHPETVIVRIIGENGKIIPCPNVGLSRHSCITEEQAINGPWYDFVIHEVYA
jgi:hypothetical protein